MPVFFIIFFCSFFIALCTKLEQIVLSGFGSWPNWIYSLYSKKICLMLGQLHKQHYLGGTFKHHNFKIRTVREHDSRKFWLTLSHDFSVLLNLLGWSGLRKCYLSDFSENNYKVIANNITHLCPARTAMKK